MLALQPVIMKEFTSVVMNHVGARSQKLIEEMTDEVTAYLNKSIGSSPAPISK